ncbi:hypothetical protein DSM104329_04125 [Capillimicrobium parvum]|uniref:Uncharacterized protein n=1 Tax=Capillimicrobium parvum TaxID=2884022 RepID=A0A9E6Y080_9ACTN|nr:hypothetical protein DSM104329_04125 [Capillimicrobium parvum]
METESAHFVARHAEEDAEHAAAVLEQLEEVRERAASLLPSVPDEVAVVLHRSEAELILARPALPVRRLRTAPASRRYIAGGLSGFDIHVLAPPLLEARASGVPESRAMLLRTPAALYARLAVGAANPRLPPPARIGALVRARRWAWLYLGAGPWLSGQTALARPAIARRLREGPRPAFPPERRDAELLGGTVVDLLAREEGERAAIRLALELEPRGPRDGLVRAFGGRRIDHTEDAWRAHLARLAEAG